MDLLDANGNPVAEYLLDLGPEFVVGVSSRDGIDGDLSGDGVGPNPVSGGGGGDANQPRGILYDLGDLSGGVYGAGDTFASVFNLGVGCSTDQVTGGGFR